MYVIYHWSIYMIYIHIYIYIYIYDVSLIISDCILPAGDCRARGRSRAGGARGPLCTACWLAAFCLEVVCVAVKHCASLPNIVRGFVCVLNVMRGHILRTVI
jgi:hypothetical protein